MYSLYQRFGHIGGASVYVDSSPKFYMGSKVHNCASFFDTTRIEVARVLKKSKMGHYFRDNMPRDGV